MTDPRVPLAFIPAGDEVFFSDFDDCIETFQKEQLHAYGIVPNSTLKVLQQHPMTVIFADETEIALEYAIARHIWVDRNYEVNQQN